MKNSLANFLCSISAMWLILSGMFMPLAQAAGENTEYRFERMLPQLKQPWYFSRPQGIAVAPDGSVWVADTQNHRLQHFQADGSFIAQFGIEGKDAGQFEQPGGIAVADDGSVWVADTGNHRLQHLNADGSVIVIDQVGSQGSGDGQFSSPQGIATAADGSVWVADTGNHRLQHFQPGGSGFFEYFGSKGSAAGQFLLPSGIAVAKDGSVWVADTGNNRLQHFRPDVGSFELFGRQGSAAGQFSSPSGIAITTDGRVWVADTGNNRLQQLKANGVSIAYDRGGSTTGPFFKPSGIAISSTDGSVWVADTFNLRLQHLKADGGFIEQFKGLGSAAGEFYSPVGIAVDPDNKTVWVADTFNHRLQHFSVNGVFINEVGSFGTAEGQFNFPKGIAIASDHSVWVADTENHRLQHFNANGVFIEQFGSKGKAAGQFEKPGGIAVAANGSVWVADTGNHRLQHLNVDGASIAQIGIFGSGEGQFSCPKGIAIAADGSLWVADTGNYRLQHFKADGSFIKMFGSFGSAYGQLNNPLAIATAADGSVWVAYDVNSRLQHFNVDGGMMEQFGNKGSAVGQFINPEGIAVSPEGSLWVADTANHRLQKFVLRNKPVASHSYKAIILAGGGQKLGNLTNSIWDGTWRVAQKAFRALSLQGFKVHDEIKFLTAGDTKIDLDANTYFDDLEFATKDSLSTAITDWAKDAADVVLYLADHGGPGKLQVNSTEILQVGELNAWISNLQQHIPGKVTVIVESCNSGSFLKYLARPKRYLLASAREDQAAVIANDGLNSFSYTFWSEVATGAKVQNAFNDARQAMSATLIDGQGIDAQMDDDGDGQFNQQDYAALGDYCFGNCNIVTAGAAPNIHPLIFNHANSLNLNIKVDHLQPLEQAWVLVQRPDDQTADTSIPLNFEKIPLDCNAQDLCTGKYTRFDVQGDYLLQFYAMDRNKAISLPETLTVSQTQGIPISRNANKISCVFGYLESNFSKYYVPVNTGLLTNGANTYRYYEKTDSLLVYMPADGNLYGGYGYYYGYFYVDLGTLAFWAGIAGC